MTLEKKKKKTYTSLVIVLADGSDDNFSPFFSYLTTVSWSASFPTPLLSSEISMSEYEC